MADAALARREARRKRILENSHNRLQLISNITNDECCKESPVKIVRTSVPEQNNEISVTSIENTPIRGPIYNGVTNSEPITYEPLSDNNLQDVFFGEQETNDSTPFAFAKAEPAATSFFEKLTTYKQDSFKYANILLLLNGMNQQQTMKLMSVLHWGSIVLQDVCIYLFTTICIQSLWIVMNTIIS